MSAFSPVELEHLLNRPIRRILGAADRRAFAGRRVLITGAGGSIGSELARQVAMCEPARLTILDHCEHALFQVEQELRDLLPSAAIEPLLADVTRSPFVRQAFGLSRPHVAYHAAAYKHVTMAERAACAAVNVNVLGTANVVVAARDAGARFVLISSDKAAAPSSVMGATKRFAEMVVMRESTGAFRPVVVRFGNVAGSSGSLLPILRERIRAGRPVPITDPDATRYFMTGGEAAALVMKADLQGRGGETYWLDMGDPIRVGDMAERLMALEAAAGYERVPIEIVGLRPGEKRQERLAEQGTSMTATAHPCIWVAGQPPLEPDRIADGLRRLRLAVTAADSAMALEVVRSCVAGFRPTQEALASAFAQAVAAAQPALGTAQTA